MDQLRRVGEAPSPWAGIPILIKDNLCMKDTATTCGSKILEGCVFPYDATVVSLLKQKGFVILGKTNMDEFAMGSSTENSAMGPTRNPWNLDHTPGGSSGGSAAAVAAGFVPCALGSDTGGSIRQPAAFCGVVGMKPTYGFVSRYGLVAFASSLDQVGPLARTVRDVAALVDVISVPDPLDSTSSFLPRQSVVSVLDQGVRGMVIGMPKEYFGEGLDDEVRSGVMKGIQCLRDAGAAVKEISLPKTQYAIATYYILSTAEASSNLARYDGVQYGLRKSGNDELTEMYRNTRRLGFGREVKRRIMLGTYSLSSGYYDAYYSKALRVQEILRREFAEAFRTCQLLVTPTTSTAAFKLGERINDPIAMYLSDALTVSANLVGIPAVSVPCGLTDKRLPIGIQLWAGPFHEQLLLRGAWILEQSLGTLGIPDWEK